MVWNAEKLVWVVYQHPRSARKTKILIETIRERDAVAVLLGDPGNS